MLGILCGLESEARIARKIADAHVVCAAARPDKARVLARTLVAQGATSLISFGIAGSLSSQIKVGDVLLGTTVVSAKDQWSCNQLWINHLTKTLPMAKTGGCYGSEKLIGTLSEKQNIHQNTGCLFVDMESQCAAEVAAEAHIPLIVIRTICDDATMPVPHLVMAAVKPDGGIDIRGALASFVKQPSQLGAVFDIMRGTHKALTALGTTTKLISEPSH